MDSLSLYQNGQILFYATLLTIYGYICIKSNYSMNILLPIYTVQWFAPWCYISYNGLSRDKLVKRVFRSNRHMAYAYPMFCPMCCWPSSYIKFEAHFIDVITFWKMNIGQQPFKQILLSFSLFVQLCSIFHATKPIFMNIEHINSYGFSRTLTASLSLSLVSKHTHTFPKSSLMPFTIGQWILTQYRLFMQVLLHTNSQESSVRCWPIYLILHNKFLTIKVVHFPVIQSIWKPVFHIFQSKHYSLLHKYL